MCGIAGAINTSIKQRALVKLHHRGPDSNGVWNFENVELIHLRLAIIDLTPGGHQPMVYKQWAITFNGEIYNYNEIKAELEKLGYAFDSTSDTEVILKSVVAWGLDKALERFNGMWAFALYNINTKNLVLCRDRIGKKPLYYIKAGDKFAFASEIKALPPEYLGAVDKKALIQFTSLAYIPSPASYYENVKKLEPAHYLEINTTTFKSSITKYWSLPERVNSLISYEEAVAGTESLLESAVKYRMIADIEVGAFLSGGIDSSLIVALAQKQSAKKIKTFSIGFDHAAYDESKYAAKVAAHLGTDHHTHIFKAGDVLKLVENFDYYFDEPFGDAAALPTMILSEITKKEVTVALSGDGGDELFIGYDRYFFTEKYHSIFKRIPAVFRKAIAVALSVSGKDKAIKMAYPVSHPSLENFYSVLYTAVKPWELNTIFQKDFIASAYDKKDISLQDLLMLTINWKEKDIKENLSKIDFYRNLPDCMLAKVDRASMKHSLEARCPILDYKIAEFAHQIPSAVKIRDGQSKSILKDILYKHVPEAYFQRPKQGFVIPLKEWFRGELKDILRDKINSLDSSVFNKKKLNELFLQHCLHNKNYQALFWNLLKIK